MTWHEAKEKAESCDNFPTNITDAEKKRYIQLQAEVSFNEHHKANVDYTEYAKDEKHRIIAGCMFRKQRMNL